MGQNVRRTTIHCITLREANFKIHLLTFKVRQFILEMLAKETFVKLYSIIVIDVLISGMQTSITSGSGLARTRPAAG